MRRVGGGDVAGEEAILNEAKDNLGEATERIRATRYSSLRQIEVGVLFRGFGIP